MKINHTDRTELADKARAYMEDQYASMKATDEDRWMSRLGMLYDFIAKLADGELGGPENKKEKIMKTKGIDLNKIPCEEMMQGGWAYETDSVTVRIFRDSGSESLSINVFDACIHNEAFGRCEPGTALDAANEILNQLFNDLNKWNIDDNNPTSPCSPSSGVDPSVCVDNRKGYPQNPS